MESQQIEDIFAKASRLDESKKGSLTEKEWNQERRLNGAKRFKRKALGLCGSSSVKSLEEMARLLYETGVVSSVKEGQELTPTLVGKSITYSDSTYILKVELGFEEIKNSKDQRAYRVYTFAHY